MYALSIPNMTLNIGADSTAGTLYHTLWQLAIHPDIQEKVAEELKASGLSTMLDELLPADLEASDEDFLHDALMNANSLLEKINNLV